MTAASPLPSAGVMMVCLLGAVRLSPAERRPCPCPVIPAWPGTRTPPEACRQINSTFRYSCLDGRVRKAGTSNRIRCELQKGNVQWKLSSLQCIDDPSRPKPPATTKSTIPTSSRMSRSSAAHDGEKIVNTDGKLHDAATPTTVKPWEVETSTFSLVASGNQTREAHSGGSRTATILSVLLPMAIGALVVIGYMLYRRRSRKNTEEEEEEEEEEQEEAVPMVPQGELPP